MHLGAVHLTIPTARRSNPTSKPRSLIKRKTNPCALSRRKSHQRPIAVPCKQRVYTIRATRFFRDGSFSLPLTLAGLYRFYAWEAIKAAREHGGQFFSCYEMVAFWCVGLRKNHWIRKNVMTKVNFDDSDVAWTPEKCLSSVRGEGDRTGMF